MNNASILTTHRIEIWADSAYMPEYSNPLNGDFMFSYRVKIKNNNSFPVKILERAWLIFDSIEQYRAVNGWGVIGIQPMIKPGEEYEYVSATVLHSEMGTQLGEYIMLNIEDNTNFTVGVPKMVLVDPAKNN